MQQGCFTPLRRVKPPPSPRVKPISQTSFFRGTIKHLVHYFVFPTRRPPVLIQTISQRSYLQKADYPRDRLAEPWICYLKVINTAVVFWSYLSLVSTGAAVKLRRIKIHLPRVVRCLSEMGWASKLSWVWSLSSKDLPVINTATEWHSLSGSLCLRGIRLFSCKITQIRTCC